MMTTQAQIRDAFWDELYPEGKPHAYKGKTQNQLPTNVRCAFVDFVDSLARNGEITEALASRVTL